MSHTKSNIPTEAESSVATQVEVEEESQVIIHCAPPSAEAYRIWPTTYLIEGSTGRKVNLITAFNISFAPKWTLNTGKGFTLVFEGLSKSCAVFDLVEEISQPGGFHIHAIVRNNTDIYNVSLD